MNKKIKSTIFLMLTAIIWGTAFVAQREGMSSIGPFMFSALRMYLGTLTLIPIIYITLYRKKLSRNYIPLSACEEKAANKLLIQGSLWCGVIIFFAANFQQVGLVSTSAGKTAFITTLYILLVPIIGIFLKRKLHWYIWLAVAMGTIGLYFLTITSSLTIAFGDLVILIGAFFWALHILCMDYYAPKVMVTKLIAIQFFISGTLSLIVSLFTEPFLYEGLVGAMPTILYTGVMSSGLAFTFQGLGQKDANPTTASIILSTEALFGAIAGYLFLSEIFTQREFLGCVLMFSAIIISQLPTKADKQLKINS
ncbi:MAG: DMT family transporter [Peptostreptococcaceae bacterium]|nr:DMT family transporter [Peptostreptococcaceae bacterium]